MATEATNGAAGEVPPVTFTALKPQVFVESSKANDAVAFYKAAFGAEEVNRVTHPKRKADQDLPLLLSAEIKLGSSTILISDLADDSTVKSTGLVFCLETEDIEGAVEKAVKAGGEGQMTEGEGAWLGGRVGKVKDPYGVVWLICTPPAAAKRSGDVEA
ncbi:hypothetical protein OSB04_000986 [Centaurea solstitialis]|uniref:VOC domain-containing protein n=1 Tax=Centaurea solstitialis TaxID=347529 RepID=A0AA38TQ61_9ASTR|nr:hypothetical protein OSB04_000986 [Centaurea solstitialis]